MDLFIISLFIHVCIYNLHDSLEYTQSSLEIHHKQCLVKEPLVLRLLLQSALVIFCIIFCVILLQKITVFCSQEISYIILFL